MKQLFHIVNKSADGNQQILSLEIGEKYAAFAVTDKTGDYLYELAYCSVKEMSENSLVEFFSAYSCLQQSFYQVKIAYDFSQSVLTASTVYQSGESGILLKTMFGATTGMNILSELIPEWQLYNTYSVPVEVQQWVSNKFPAASYRHQYSLAIKNAGAASGNGRLVADFRTVDFTLLAIKDSRLLLAQTFEYTTPEDVVFYLLKTCQQFLFSQKEAQLQLSGLIDKQSSLYKELYQYFINLEFREASWNTGSEYPLHFFTSLNHLARCAS